MHLTKIAIVNKTRLNDDDKLLVISNVLTVTGVQILKIVYWALVKKSCRSTPSINNRREGGI